jgi:Queuosine biosynthesis protein
MYTLRPSGENATAWGIRARDSARLLLDRTGSRLEHCVFHELPDLLRPGDVLVANNSRVLPARLRGRRAGTGGAVEALLLHERGDDEWSALVRPGRRIRPGETLLFAVGGLTATVLDRGRCTRPISIPVRWPGFWAHCSAGSCVVRLALSTPTGCGSGYAARAYGILSAKHPAMHLQMGYCR